MSTRRVSRNGNVNGSVKAVRREMNNTKLRQSVINCHPIPPNVPEERRSQLHRGGKLKSNIIKKLFNSVCVCVCVRARVCARACVRACAYKYAHK